jgi:transposase
MKVLLPVQNSMREGRSCETFPQWLKPQSLPRLPARPNSLRKSPKRVTFFGGRSDVELGYARTRPEAGCDVQLCDDGAMEQRIPASHPIRAMRVLVDQALERMDPALKAMYAERGRPSIAPERLLGAQLLMVLYSIRSEIQLMEPLNVTGAVGTGAGIASEHRSAVAGFAPGRAEAEKSHSSAPG